MTIWDKRVKPEPQDDQELDIGDGFSLLIDDNYELLTQSASGGTVWSGRTKPTTIWS